MAKATKYFSIFHSHANHDQIELDLNRGELQPPARRLEVHCNSFFLVPSYGSPASFREADYASLHFLTSRERVIAGTARALWAAWLSEQGTHVSLLFTLRFVTLVFASIQEKYSVLVLTRIHLNKAYHEICKLTTQNSQR